MRLWHVPVLILLGAAFGLAQANIRRTGALSIRVNECAYDAGLVDPYARLDRSFFITNTGRRTLDVSRVESNQEASATISQSYVTPGETASLRLSKKSTVSKPGPLRLQALVHLDRIERPLRFTLYATIIPAFPESLNVGKVLRGQKHVARYDVYHRDSNTAEVPSVEYDRDFFDLETLLLREKTHIRLSLRKDVPYGIFRKNIALKTRGGFGPAETVISGEVLQPVISDQDHVSLGVIKAFSEASATIIVSSPYKQPFLIQNASCDIPGLQLQPISKAESVSYVVRMNGTPGLQGGSIVGRLRIEVSAVPHLIELPIYGLLDSMAGKEEGKRIQMSEGAN